MNWRPQSPPETAIARAEMLNTARDFFATRNVLEVSTPSLSARTSTDPNIESIVARVAGRELYLHTSPEHFMKRLLAACYPDIFQICRVYRDGEVGRYHVPEFTMIEWYRRDFALKAIMQETIELITSLLSKKSLAQSSSYVSYSEAFENALSLDPLLADVDFLASAVNADRQLQDSLGHDRDAWLDLAMSTVVAKSFATDRLTVVFHYPASQAALARICPDDNRVADRFEVYFGPLEIGNGFVELTNAQEQKARFESDQRKRDSSGLPAYEIDHALIDALSAGMPDAAGVAIGVDRLLMINEGQEDIESVFTFTPGT